MIFSTEPSVFLKINFLNVIFLGEQFIVACFW